MKPKEPDAARRETRRSVQTALHHARAILQARAWELRLVGLPLAARAVEALARRR